MSESRQVRYFVTTYPEAATCPVCGRLKLTGLADGLEYRVDPLPLTAPGELAALRRGGSSYSLSPGGVLTRRTVTQIEADAHRARPPVLATHACAHPPELAHTATEHTSVCSRLIAPDKARQDAVDLFTQELGAVDVSDQQPPF